MCLRNSCDDVSDSCKELFKIQQERERRTYSKSSKREREASGVQVGVACCVCVVVVLLLYDSVAYSFISTKANSTSIVLRDSTIDQLTFL